MKTDEYMFRAQIHYSALMSSKPSIANYCLYVIYRTDTDFLNRDTCIEINIYKEIVMPIKKILSASEITKHELSL